MRRFVVLGHTAPLEPAFSLDDLAGGAGRLDVLCRCVSAAVFLSHDIRTDVRVMLVLQDQVTIRIDGGSLRYAAPDERTIGGLLRGALEAKADTVGHQSIEASPGIHVSQRGLATVLDGVAGPIIHLHQAGTPITALDPPTDPTFVVSDHQDLTGEEHALLDELAEHRVALSPNPLHADHAITIAHNYLDTDGYATYR